MSGYVERYVICEQVNVGGKNNLKFGNIAVYMSSTTLAQYQFLSGTFSHVSDVTDRANHVNMGVM